MSQKEKNPAFVLQKVKDVSIEERPIPKLESPYDVKVHVKATGICGSDVHYYTDGKIGDFVVEKPMILGHESAGIVVEVGSKVTNVKVGDKVAMEPEEPCRYCEYCRSGKYNLCPDIKFAATPPYDGTLTKYYILPHDMVVPLPENVTLEEGALMEPLSVAIHVCRQAGVEAHKTVIVFGAGPVGLLSAAVSKAWGAKQVISVDVQQSRLEFARSFAATGTFIPDKPGKHESNIDYAQKVGDKIKKQFNLGEGADCVIDATGAEVCTLSGLYACGKGGTFVQAGMGKDVLSAFPITLICVREINVKGSFRYIHGCYKDAADLLGRGLVDAKRLITHRFKFEEAEKAFKTFLTPGAGAIKIIIGGVE